MKDAPLKRAGVMGWPVGHSLSPYLHGFWLRTFGVQGEYIALGVEPKDLETRLRNLQADGFAGCNITVPHKENALKIMDEVEPLAQRIGAVNTVVVRSDGTLYGSNTDGFGFMENLKAGPAEFDPTRGPAVVLGAGGAARAIVVALLDAGVCEIRILNRTRERAEQFAAEFGNSIHVYDWDNRATALHGANLLVNTTVLGMTDQPPLEIDLATLPKAALVTDIVYNPLETPLLAAARARGNPVVDGLGMLLHQARPGFEAWFGVVAQVTDDLRAEILSRLA